MAKQYKINIINGSGTENILNDTYSVTASVNGYDNTTIDPSTLSVVEGTNSYELEISATGTLTLHVTEDGTESGTPIVGATFYRCDSLGTTYGDIVTTDSSGNAIFSNVPFSSIDAPKIYYKQSQSDGNHDFDNTLKETTLTESTGVVQVINTLPVTRTFTLKDKNYNGLPIELGEIDLA